jgi:hypothetical protein
MIDHTILLWTASTAQHHVNCLNHLVHDQHAYRGLKQRVRLLEEGAHRMELDAKASLLRLWRGQASVSRSWAPKAQVGEVAYVDREKCAGALTSMPRERDFVVVARDKPPVRTAFGADRETGEFVTLTGASGGGKTTLIRFPLRSVHQANWGSFGLPIATGKLSCKNIRLRSRQF